MHVAFLSNPASGELNVQLATAQQLVSQGHTVTFLSAESCSSKIDRLRQAQLPYNRDLIRFVSLGSGRIVNDVTAWIQARMHLMRRTPGDPISQQTCLESALGRAEEHAAIALKVRDHLDALNPSMICVDALTPCLITGVRLTRRKFILTIPCSPGLTAHPSAFQPHPVAAIRRGSWGPLLESIYLNTRELIHSQRHPDRRAKRALVKRLGLKSYGLANDSAHCPPHWDDENCVAGIHFNTQGLLDCPRQSEKFVFVGAGVSTEPEPTSSPSTPPPPSPPQQAQPQEKIQTHFSERTWMDEAALLGEDVVYINMGSMFIWTPREFRACIAGLSAAHAKLSGRIRFLLKINTRRRSLPSSHSSSSSSLSKAQSETQSEVNLEREHIPPFIRLTSWIEDQHAVYTHPALKAFVHHGGGNSFNEAVHFGIPQLVLSQWLDTHEYAMYAERFGLGLRSARPPFIEARDIERKILTLLGPRWQEFKDNCQTWAMRSRLGGGVKTAAEIVLFHARIQEQARIRAQRPVLLEKEKEEQIRVVKL
ncbi:glycosyltransferase [Aspergillus undulatus]|uniref:glycosyltransferase n=1 Tax=Aspergillus undulatus TaxID=1810928 RepID=UPI003CCE31D0